MAEKRGRPEYSSILSVCRVRHLVGKGCRGCTYEGKPCDHMTKFLNGKRPFEIDFIDSDDENNFKEDKINDENK